MYSDAHLFQPNKPHRKRIASRCRLNERILIIVVLTYMFFRVCVLHIAVSRPLYPSTSSTPMSVVIVRHIDNMYKLVVRIE